MTALVRQVNSVFQLSSSHAQLKKENPQTKLATMQHKRKHCVIKTTGNTVQREKGQTWIWHCKQQCLSPSNAWLEFQLGI